MKRFHKAVLQDDSCLQLLCNELTILTTAAKHRCPSCPHSSLTPHASLAPHASAECRPTCLYLPAFTSRLLPHLVSSCPNDFRGPPLAMHEHPSWVLLLRHIVRVIGIGADDPTSDASVRGSLFMVQEYLMGGSLRRIVMEQMLDPFSVSTLLRSRVPPAAIVGRGQADPGLLAIL